MRHSRAARRCTSGRNGPAHNQNVALVLNRFTGHVSPQFHVKMDEGFHSLKQEKLMSKWQDSTFFAADASAAKTATIKRKRGNEGAQSRQRQRSAAAAAAGNDITEFSNSEGVTNAQSIHETDQICNADPQLQSPAAQALQQQSEGSPNPEVRTGADLGNQTDQAGAAVGRRSSARMRKPAQRPIEVVKTETAQHTAGSDDVPGELFCQSVLSGHDNSDGDDNPILAFKANADPDAMCRHEAVKEPDKDEFVKAMHKEIEDQMNNGNFSIVRRSEVPGGKAILPAAWQMKRKRDIKTRQVKKCKARLNIDGSRMQQGAHCDQSHAPVASWTSTRPLLTLAAVHGWHTTQIDCVLAFPQAPVERETCMEVPKGIDAPGADRNLDVLKLNRNVCGQKQAGRVWNKHLVDKLVNKVGFAQSKVDECVFFKGSVVCVLHTDDSIIAGPSKREVDDTVEAVRKAKLDIAVEGDIQDFLGVNIDRHDDGSIQFSQPHLIDKIMSAAWMDRPGIKPKDAPAASSHILR